CDYNTYGGMIIDDLLCTDFSRLGKWNLMIKPRCFYHPLMLIFNMTRGTLHHVTHAIDKTYLYSCFIVKCYFRRFLRYEFWLGSHNCLTGGSLWQLIYCPLLAMDIFNSRYD